MIFLNCICYLIVNLMGYHVLPHFIRYKNIDCYNMYYYNNEDRKWYIDYYKSTIYKSESLLEVAHRFKYVAFLKMVYLLFKNKKHLNFIIDY